MAFNEVIAELVMPVVKSAKLKSVCELGNQSFKARKIAAEMGKTFESTKQFYQHFGVERYLAIDINERMDAVAMDLNDDLAVRYNFLEQFDLVTNNGTGEHLFNQAQVFKNCHELCKLGGFIIHHLPAVGWVNHGFFNVQPVLYVDLAAANGYELLRCGLANSKRKMIDLQPRDFGQAIKRHSMDTPIVKACQRLDYQANAYAVMRKVTTKAFTWPLQGKYVIDIESSELAARYAPA